MKTFDQNCNVVSLHQTAPSRVAKKFADGLTGEDISPLDRLMMVQHLNRKWRRHLNGNEYGVMSYILDRTVLWGKPTFKACHRNILEGNEDFAGIGLKKTVYHETLTSLEKRGAITRKRARDFVILGLNFDWKLEENTMAVPVPKRKKGEKSGFRSSRSPESGSSEVRYPDTEEREYYKGNTIRTSAKASSDDWDEDDKKVSSGFEKKTQDFSAPLQRIEDKPTTPVENCNLLQSGQAATERVREKLNAKTQSLSDRRANAVQKAMTKRNPNSVDIELVWKAAMEETFPSTAHVGWGKEQRGKIKRVMGNYTDGNTVAFPVLLDWAVRHWSRLLMSKFKFMKNAPQVPPINYLTSEGMLRMIADAYVEGDIDRMIDGDEQDELKRLMLTGMTEQDALAKIGERRARQTLKAEIAEAKSTTAQKLREIKDREDRALRMEGFAERLAEKGIPIKEVPKAKPGQLQCATPIPHPQSETAKRLRREQREKEEAENPQPPMPKNDFEIPTFKSWEEVQEEQRQLRQKELAEKSKLPVPKDEFGVPRYKPWDEIEAELLAKERAKNENT